MRTIVLVSLLTTVFGLCRAKEIREDWIKNDSIFINILKDAYLSNPTSIEKHLEPWEIKRENLGYVGKTVQNVPLISAKMCHEPRPDFEKIATVMPLSVSVRIVPFWRAA
jgi:hypothetical protein